MVLFDSRIPLTLDRHKRFGKGNCTAKRMSWAGAAHGTTRTVYIHDSITIDRSLSKGDAACQNAVRNGY